MTARAPGAGLERLLRALELPELRRVARAYGAPRGSREGQLTALCARREVDAEEIARHVLTREALVGVARALGLPAGGTRGQLAVRVARAVRFLPFDEARAHARSLGLGSIQEWRRWRRGRAASDDLPRTPDGVYRRGGWQGWPDFLGYSRRRGRRFRAFESARAFVRGLGLRNQLEWAAWCRGERSDLPGRPIDIPTTPMRTYHAKWKGLGDWLGSGKVANKMRAFRAFEGARAFARGLGLRSQAEWHAWCQSPRRPADIPTNPHRTYAAQWKSLGDWLGTGVVATHERRFRPFVQARALARSLGLRNHGEWVAWSRSAERPPDVPANPLQTYRAKWTSWGDFLGTGNVAPTLRRFRAFAAARSFARGLGLRSKREWDAWCRGELRCLGWQARPADIPAEPRAMYRGRGWLGMRDWLGTDGGAGRS